MASRTGPPPPEPESVAAEAASALGMVIRRYRRAKGWSQGQLALYARVSRSFITKLEQQQYQTVAPATLQRLAAALDASLSELLAALGITQSDTANFTEVDVAGLALQAVWAQLTAEEQREVLEHARWVLDRRLRLPPIMPNNID